MTARGELRPGAHPATLAAATLASIQGGLVLTQTRRDPQQLASPSTPRLRTCAPPQPDLTSPRRLDGRAAPPEPLPSGPGRQKASGRSPKRKDQDEGDPSAEAEARENVVRVVHPQRHSRCGDQDGEQQRRRGQTWREEAHGDREGGGEDGVVAGTSQGSTRDRLTGVRAAA
jgi:hypothetical protein